MNINLALKKICKKAFPILLSEYIVIFFYAFWTSVVMVKVTSGLFSSIIFGDDGNKIKREMLIFTIATIVSIVTAFFKKIIVFLRVKHTAYEIEGYSYNYFYNIAYHEFVDKNEMQAYLTNVIIEYNSAVFELISKTMQNMVIIGCSIMYALLLEPYSLIIIIFIIVLLILSMRNVGVISSIQSEIVTIRNDLYKNLWQGIENLEIERFLNPRIFFKDYNNNAKALEQQRILYNKIAIKNDFYSQYGSSLTIILAVIIVLAFDGLNILAFEKVLPLILILPNITNGIFEIPSILAGKKHVNGLKENIDKYFTFNSLKESKIEQDDLMDSIEAIEIRNISFSYDERQIITNLSLLFKQGSITVIYGENGSGKSTLLKIMAMLLPVQEGNISLIGNECKMTIDHHNCDDINLREAYWRKIYYFNSEEVILYDSLKKNIVMNASFNEDKYKESIDRADIAYLDYLETIDSSKISDGEKQKIGFARVFYHAYNIIFMDEATSHMDFSSESKIMIEFRKFVEANDIIVIAANHRETFNSFADRIFAMTSGDYI